MNLPTVKELVSNGNRVHFAFLRAGFAHYLVEKYDEETDSVTTYLFTVPLDDIGTATLRATDKAITFMRWIRKAVENKELVFYSVTRNKN